MANSVWLSSGGAYWIIGALWVASALGWLFAAQRIAKALGIPNDGCLQGAANLVLTLVGGAAGLLAAPYPYFMLTSFFGMVLLPAVATWFFASRNRR